MGRFFMSVGGGLRLAACVAVAGAVFAATTSPAAAARNEARWYQQNYCMVKAYEALGKNDFATYDKNAKQSRAKLMRAGVPEHHIRELETFINKTIRQTQQSNKAHQAPRICMQWYST
jgi:hypothetical protein